MIYKLKLQCSYHKAYIVKLESENICYSQLFYKYRTFTNVILYILTKNKSFYSFNSSY